MLRLSSKSHFILLSSFVLITLWLIQPIPGVMANTVIISELYAAPASGEKEWFEIYNYGAETIVLNGWTAYDELSSPSLLHSFGDELLDPNHTLVVLLSGAKLNNTGDAVTLYESSGAEVDYLSYPKARPGYSWHRVATDSAEIVEDVPNPGFWQNRQIEEINPSPLPTSLPPNPSIGWSPTPTHRSAPIVSITRTPTPVFDISGIVISEVLSCPVSPETEWVELWNSLDYDVTLDNWSIADAQSNRVTFSQHISAQHYAVVSWNKAMLNNSGDVVILENAQRQPQLSLEIPNCLSGHSYALIGSEYQWVTPPTKGYNNSSSIPAHTPNPKPTQSVTMPATATSFATTDQTSVVESAYAQTENPAATVYKPIPQQFSISHATAASTQRSQPLASSSSSVATVQKHESPWPYLSVIMGGLLIAISGYLLYVTHNSPRHPV